MKNKECIVYKQRKLNGADFDNFTLNDYQVYINLIAKIGGVDDKGNYLPPEHIKRKYTLSAQEFSNNFNTEISYSYKIIKSAVDKLMKTDIKIKEVGGYARINVCSYAKYEERKGFIDIEFTDRIIPYLAQVTEKFTLYKLKEISEFKSIYTVRLYELLHDFKDTGYLKISVDNLRKSFGTGDKFKLYGHLKSKTFTYAVKEINNHCHADLDFQEIKEGRKVVAIKFTFNKTKIAKRYKQDGTYTNEYIKPKKKTDTNSKYPDTVLDGQMSFEDKQQKQGQIGNVASKAIQNLQVN